MTTPAVELTRVSKSYGAQRALRHISLRIDPGEAVGYLGPNGAGKTTTLRLLAGLTKPTEGSVRILGQDPAIHPDAALRRVGVLVETPGIVPYLTPADLLGHASRLKQLTDAGEVARVAERLTFADHLDRPMGTLSTGMCRRVLLGVALLGDPDVVLLDEPTLGLDPAGRADLRRLLRGIRHEGRTILLSTHLLDDVEEVCDRVLFLREGALVGDERVDLANAAPGEVTRRRAEFEFMDDVDASMWARLPRPEEAWTQTASRHLTVEFAGGDGRQAEIVGSLVRVGAPLLSAGRSEPDLHRRYLERIGREDDA